jgi:cobalamin biosynthesis Co2+ chelatase CbiK
LGREALTFSSLPISLEQTAYTIPRLLNSTEFLQSVFYDDLSSDDDYKKIKNAYVARGIGQLVMSSDVQKLEKVRNIFIQHIQPAKFMH